MTVQGVDLSHFNAVPDLTGVGFVALKATQGTSFVDSTYASRAPEMRSLGKVLIPYHFGTMSVDPKAQAAWFAQHAMLSTGDVIALDWENPADGSADDWKNYTTEEIVNQGVALVESLATSGHRELVYMNRSTYANGGSAIVPHTDGLWIASPDATPTMPFLFWQYTISNGVDRDQVSTLATQQALVDWSMMTTPNPVTPTNVDLLALESWSNSCRDMTDTLNWVNTPASIAGQANLMVQALKQMAADIAAIKASMGVVSLPDGATFTYKAPGGSSGAA